jgi:hypothetical protein
MGKYKHGKQTTPINFEDFQQIMEREKFVKSSHKSLLAFLYWTGVRQSEALERIKEDFKKEDNFLIIYCPSKKHGKREFLKLPSDLPYVDLIIDQIEKTRKSKRNPMRKVWNIDSTTAWRIVKRVMPKHYPHFFRLNRAVNFLNDPTTTTPEMLAWFGWRNISTINKYLGFSERHLDKQAERLRKEIKG